MPGALSTILVCLLIAFVLFLSLRKLWKDKNNGKTCCGGGCQGCTRCGENNKKQKLR